jgi:hypothetical protein
MVRARTFISLFVVVARIARFHTIQQRCCIVDSSANRTLCKAVEIWHHSCIGGRDAADPLHQIKMTHAISTTAKLAALFGGSLLALFVASLAVEDQRHFVACRASVASADACLLQISGR